jgi:tellurite resistance protein
MPTLLFGTRPERVERGEFTCPDCGPFKAYERVVVRRSIRVTGWLVLPMHRLGEYIECGGCRSTYRPEVLAYDAGGNTLEIMAEYQRVMRRLLALMMVTDGEIAEPEIDTIRTIFEAVSGKTLARGAVLEEAGEVTRRPATAARYLASVVGYLNEYGKEQVLRAAAMVSRADGRVHERERELVVRLGAVLGVEPDCVGRVLREFS